MVDVLSLLVDDHLLATVDQSTVLSSSSFPAYSVCVLAGDRQVVPASANDDGVGSFRSSIGWFLCVYLVPPPIASFALLPRLSSRSARLHHGGDWILWF